MRTNPITWNIYSILTALTLPYAITYCLVSPKTQFSIKKLSCPGALTDANTVPAAHPKIKQGFFF